MKKYINGMIVKEIETKYGKMLKVSIKVEDFAKEVKENAKDGWLNLVISERQTPSEKGVTHSVWLDVKNQEATAEKDDGMPF